MKLKITLLAFLITFSFFNKASAQSCDVFVTVGQGYLHSCGATIEINPHGGGIDAVYTLTGPNAARTFSPIPNGHWHFSNATIADSGLYTLTSTGGHTGGGPHTVPCSPSTITFTLTISGCCVSPTISCAGNIGVNTDQFCSAIVNYPPATVTGTNPVVTYSIPSGSVFPLGTTTVTATATNGCGTATCSFDVTVTDIIKPNITAPADIVINANNAGCTGVVNLGTPVTSDNCSVASVTNDAPATFPLGKTTVTWTVTDGSGNKSTAVQTVTVLNPVTVAVSYTEGVYGVLYGYTAMNSALLKATATGGTISYSWSPATGLNNANIANPTFTASAACSPTYTVTAINSFGCTASASQYICVKDVSDPKNPDKVRLCHNGNTISIAQSAVAAHLAHLSSHADTWGPCGTILTCSAACNMTTSQPFQFSLLSNKTENVNAFNKSSIPTEGLTVTAYPNPFADVIKIKVASTDAAKYSLSVSDAGNHVIETLANLQVGTDITVGKKLLPGIYFIEVRQGDTYKRIRLIKQ